MGEGETGEGQDHANRAAGIGSSARKNRDRTRPRGLPVAFHGRLGLVLLRAAPASSPVALPPSRVW
jgi:hypothetical protein